ncbi:MAG: GNAT family N-acetyltransferase [Beijerinckiaceae bacterium]
MSGAFHADELRDLGDNDADAVIALTAINERETSHLDRDSLARLLAVASFAKGYGDAPDAFVIAMAETADYDNANFRWFKARYSSFVYIDRIVVAQALRGQGIARRLYETLFIYAKAHNCQIVGCEVNIDPPNPGSDSFHAAMGFAEAGQALLDNGKHVRYMMRSVL